MKIIIGLGNPGKKYENTRHSTGFFVLEKMKVAWNFPDFALNKKFKSEICKSTLGKDEIILIKPRTFINLSGEAIKALLAFYKFTPDDILVIHDDVDIMLGKYKIATDSSSAGHNGIQNIIDTLGTKKFMRIRIGIGKTPEEKKACPISAHDYVLEKFPKEELEIIEKISERVIEEIKDDLIK